MTKRPTKDRIIDVVFMTVMGTLVVLLLLGAAGFWESLR
mgnify:CR=1 FL=1